MGQYYQPPDLVREINDLRSRLAALERTYTAGGIAWQALTLENGYGNIGNPYAPAAYYIDGSGRVFLRGEVSETGGSSGAILHLPAGARPAFSHLLPSMNASFPSLLVSTDGSIIPNPIPTASSATFSLDSVAFRTI